jgi:hypothetical protein
LISIENLVLAKSSDRSILADQANNPLEVLAGGEGGQLHFRTFNFFTDSSRGGDISKEFWITKRLDFSSRYELDFLLAGDDFQSIVGLKDFVIEIRSLASELRFLSPHVFGILLPSYENEEVDWDSMALVVSVSEHSSKISKAKVSDLATRINHNTQRDSYLGKKGLQYSTSAIESFLSKTKNIYPGDCDALVFENSKPKVIIEFKKHTLMDPISEWTISKYFHNADQYKYRSLQSLSRNLSNSSGTYVPIVVYYFATKFHGARLDVLSNSAMEIIGTSGDLDKREIQSNLGSMSNLLDYLAHLV